MAYNQQSIDGQPVYSQVAYQASPLYSSSGTPPQPSPSSNQAYNSFPNSSMNQLAPSGSSNGLSLQSYPPVQQLSAVPAINSYSSVQPSLTNGNFAAQFPTTQSFPPGQPSYGAPSAFPSPQAGNFVGQAQLPNGSLLFQV